MAWGSESAAEKVPRWAVGPTEDVVQALMETLVDPLLPLRVTSVPPSEDVQIAVAKQMHAVVLLYNYHHRKQKPELVFLEFLSFCKLAIVIRPPLIVFMKMMKESKPEELSDAEDWLSVTEKAIRDACDISLGLDASKDVPNIEGWPISKVAVLLIDLKKENCVLQFNAVTEGGWFLIEKELNESTSTTLEISAGEKTGNKRKRDNLKVPTYNTEFLQLGYDTVKDITGISSSELKVLETHMTYSLSKEKSAACFYIMQCPGSFNEHEQVPLSFLLESLQGPLAEKLVNGLWKATPSVKSHHMLPYVELILCWLSGHGMKVNSSDEKTSENCYSNNKCDDSSHGHAASPVDNFQSTEKESNLRNNLFVKGFDILDSAESSQNRILENLSDGSEQPDKGLSSSPLGNPREVMVRVDNMMQEFEEGCDLANRATEVAGSITLENPETESGQYRRLSRNTVDDNAREKFNEKHDVEHSAENDDRRACPGILDVDRVGCGKDILSGPPWVWTTTHENDLTNICIASGENKILNPKLKVYYYRRKKNPSMRNAEQLREALPDLKVEVDSLKSNHTQRSDEKVAEEEGYLTNTCNGTGTASTEDQQAQLEAEIKQNVEVQATSDSSRSNHIRSRDETVSDDKGDHIHKCNQTGSAAEGNQLAQMEVDSLKSIHTQRSAKKISGDEGYISNTCNQNGTAATGYQLAQVEVKLKHELGEQTISASDQLQVEAKYKNNLGVPTISASDHVQNALALLYPKRQKLYSQICNMEDALALCEDNVSRIRDGGEVDLARQCIKSVISGKLHLPLENGTQVQDIGNQQDESQHGKHTRLSEAYLPGMSSCQDLEYTCLRNDWRLPRYLIETSDGKFMSSVVVEGKDVKLHARGGFESKPCVARESAAAKMIAVMHNTSSLM